MYTLDYYKILGVSPGAANDEISKAFRTKMGSATNDNIQELREAFYVLTNAAERQKYDQWYAGAHDAAVDKMGDVMNDKELLETVVAYAGVIVNREVELRKSVAKKQADGQELSPLEAAILNSANQRTPQDTEERQKNICIVTIKAAQAAAARGENYWKAAYHAMAEEARLGGDNDASLYLSSLALTGDKPAKFTNPQNTAHASGGNNTQSTAQTPGSYDTQSTVQTPQQLRHSKHSSCFRQ